MRLPRFYPILDRTTVNRRGLSVIDVATQILDGGASILQFRHKESFSRAIFEELEIVAGLCRDASAILVVNDRADIAKLLNAGLHLGQEDLAPADARRVVTAETIIGYSTHNEVQFRAAIGEPIDYVAFGPVFGTDSKQNPDPAVGVAELSRLRVMTNLPLVAIGGITRANAPSVVAAGADSVAVIADLFPESRDVRARVAEWLTLLRQTE